MNEGLSASALRQVEQANARWRAARRRGFLVSVLTPLALGLLLLAMVCPNSAVRAVLFTVSPLVLGVAAGLWIGAKL